MSYKSNKILSLLTSGFKSPMTSLSVDEKQELKNKLQKANLKNIVYLNLAVSLLTIVLLLIDLTVLSDVPKDLFPSHEYILFMYILTIPVLLIFSYLIYLFNFKKYNSSVKYFKPLIYSNVLAILFIASYYNYFELKDFNVGNTLIIFLLLVAIILRFSIKGEIVIATLYFLVYYAILNSLNFTFSDIPLVYLNGLVGIFLYLLLATVISKQTEKRFLNEILLKRKNLELSYINNELNSSRNQIEKQNDLLKESNEKLTRFAYMAAHDLKGPLRTTQNLLDILYSKYNLTFDEEDKPLIEHIMKSSKDLSNLVSNLLLFSSLTQQLPKTELIDIKETIKKVTDSLQSYIKNNNVDLVIVNELHTINANPNLIYQLFLNFINNSIKFSQKSENKKIIIESKKLENNLVEYKIQDFGIGIPHDKQDKIFDLFYKEHSKEEYSGSGIGLSICKKIVEYYNGNIWLESIPNEGTTFYFTLSIDN